jgi:hypothetical protein
VLSFELKRSGSSSSGDELEVVLDAEGLESLLAQLRFLKEGRTDHVHLMSEAWGGSHLSDRPQVPANTTIHSVKIYRR